MRTFDCRPERLRDGLIILGLCLALFAYCYSITTVSSRMMQSYHGLYHSAYVYQIFNGIIPPTNPQVIGEPSSRYWPWHALIAGLMHVFRTDAFTTMVLVNCFSMALSAFMIYRLCRILGYGTAPALAGATLFTAILSFPVDIYQLAHWFTLPSWSPSPDDIYSYFQSAFGVKVDIRFASMLQKFLNQNSFPTTVAIFLSLFYIDWKVRTERGRSRKLRLFFIELPLVVLLGLFHPLTLLFFNLWVIVSSIGDLMEEKPSSSGQAWNFLRGKLTRYLPLIIGHALILPFLLQVASQYGGGISIEAGLRSTIEQVGRTGPVFWVIAAVLVLVKLRYGRFEGRRETRLLYHFSLLALACVLFMRAPDHNEYKFALLSSIPLSMLVSGMAAHAAGGALRKNAALLFLGLVVAGQLLSTAYFRLASPWASEDPFFFQGTEVRLRPISEEARALQEACDWIKRNTPVTAYIVAEPSHRDRMLLPTIAERRVFVTLPSLETGGVKGFDDIFSLNRELLARARSGQGPYIFGDEPAFSRVSALTDRLGEVFLLTENSGVHAPSIVFSNGHFVLHRIEVLGRRPLEAVNGL